MRRNAKRGVELVLADVEVRMDEVWSWRMNIHDLSRILNALN
jgi:hypothetical protein